MPRSRFAQSGVELLVRGFSQYQDRMTRAIRTNVEYRRSVSDMRGVLNSLNASVKRNMATRAKEIQDLRAIADGHRKAEAMVDKYLIKIRQTEQITSRIARVGQSYVASLLREATALDKAAAAKGTYSVRARNLRAQAGQVQQAIQSQVASLDKLVDRYSDSAEALMEDEEAQLAAADAANDLANEQQRLIAVYARLKPAMSKFSDETEIASRLLNEAVYAARRLENSSGGLANKLKLAVDVVGSFVDGIKGIADVGRAGNEIQKIGGELGKFGIDFDLGTLDDALGGVIGKLSEFTNLGAGAGAVFQNVAQRLVAAGVSISKVATGIGIVMVAISALVGMVKLFVKVVKTVIQVTARLAKALFDLAKRVIKAVIDAVKKMIEVFRRVTNTVGNFIRNVIRFLATLIRRITFAVAAVGVLGGAFTGAFSKMRDAIKGAVQAAADFQILTVQLEGLISNQFIAADASLRQSEALARASVSAQEYLTWIRRLAVTSPFEVEQITRMFTLAQAVGFTAKEAQKLTTSVQDFSAGMGLTNEQMIRIVENFGQMRAQGKLTGTELRDLARGSLVPIADVLARVQENLGLGALALDEFREMAASGAVPVDAFVQAFIEMSEERFLGATERLSNTFRTVASNIQDFIKTVLGVEVLGPVMQRMAKMANDALQNALSPETTRQAEFLARTLLLAFNKLSDVMTKVVSPAFAKLGVALGLFGKAAKVIQPNLDAGAGAMNKFSTEVAGGISIFRFFAVIVAGVTQKVIDWLKTLADKAEKATGRVEGGFKGLIVNAFRWGAEMIAEYAKGMIMAAKTILITAINFIASIISGIFETASPPKIAPKIDIWGRDTIMEWLKGMTSADFGILKSLQGPLQSALGILVDKGLLSAAGSLELFRQISSDIGAGIAKFRETKSFEAVQGVLARLSKQAGQFGKEFSKLLKLQFKLVDATYQLELAEKRLAEARETEDKAIENVKSLTEEYNALLRAGTDPALLDARLDEINASEDAREAAIAERKAAEKGVKVAEERIDPLQEAVRTQEELINQLLEFAKVLKDATGAGGGFTIEPEWDFSGIDIGTDEIDEELENLSLSWEDLVGDFETLFEGVGTEIADAMKTSADDVKTAWRTAIDEIRNSLLGFDQESTPLVNLTGAPGEEAPPSGLLDHLSQLWQKVTDFATALREDLEPAMQKFGDTSQNLSGILENLKLIVWSVLEVWGVGDGEEGGSGLAGAIELAATWAEKTSAFVFLVSRAFAGFMVFFTIVFGFLRETINNFIAFWFETLVEPWAEGLTDMREGMSEAWDTIWEYVGDFIEKLKGDEGLPAIIDEFYTMLDGVAQAVLDYWDTLVQAGKDIIGGIVAGLWEEAETLWTAFTDIMQAGIDLLMKQLKMKSPSRVTWEIGQNVMLGMVGGLQSGAGAVTQAMVAPTLTGLALNHGLISGGGVVNNSSSTTTNMSISIGSINNGMGEARLGALVERSLARGL